MLVYLPYLILLPLILTVILYYAWNKISVLRIPKETNPITKLTILIAVRNESKGIISLLQTIEAQDYPKDKFEVIVLDDHSEDTTVDLVTDYIFNTRLNLRLMVMPKQSVGKKMALREGVRVANGTLIVTVDGDCRVGARWLTSIEYFYRTNGLKIVIGAVQYTNTNNFKDQLLNLELASLIGSGASTLQLGYPSMCNGANLAYEKDCFNEVLGYQGNEDLASGDDEFLMHKIAKKYPEKVMFQKSIDALVETAPPESWTHFFNQRKRWSSKWERYAYPHVKGLAFLVALGNMAIILNFGLSFLDSYPIYPFLVLLSAKIMLDFLFLRRVLVYFGRNLKLGVFVMAELFYPFYVLFFAFAGRGGQYLWKGRLVR